jgi:acetyl-CoA carboxylase biotin carboxyl carrier protein
MPEKFVVDGESVRGLANLLEETGLTEIEYQVGTQRIRVVRAGVQASVPHYAPPPPPPSTIHTPHVEISPPGAAPTFPPAPQGEVVPSPMVGTIYLSGEPDSAPFVKAGDFVKKGDTLLIVEAMKVMNPIRAPRDGKILEVCVEDTKPVEFGEPLVILE